MFSLIHFIDNNNSKNNNSNSNILLILLPHYMNVIINLMNLSLYCVNLVITRCFGCVKPS